MTDGRHRNPTNNPEYFTDAFFHLPHKSCNLRCKKRITMESLNAVEGPAWLLPDLAVWLGEPKRCDQLMGILKQIAEHESLIGASAHLMAVGRKGTDQCGVRLRLKECEIRNWCQDDTTSLVENANDKEVWSKLRDVFPHPYTMSDAVDWVKIANQTKPVTNFAIAVDGKAVGGIGLTLQGDILHRKSAEIGYWLGRHYWGED